MFKHFFLGTLIFCGGLFSFLCADNSDYAKEDAERQDREREYRKEDWKRQDRQREYTNEDVERRRVEDEQNQRTDKRYQQKKKSKSTPSRTLDLGNSFYAY